MVISRKRKQQEPRRYNPSSVDYTKLPDKKRDVPKGQKRLSST